MSRNRGFSLAELLVAVGIFAILATVAMPAFSSLMQPYRLNTATLQLAGDLRYAQSLAVANGACYRLHWGNNRATPQPNTYRIEKNAGGWPAETATTGSNSNVITNWSETDLGVSYPGVNLSTVKDNNNTTLVGVAFNARGSTVDLASCSTATAPSSPISLSVTSTGVTTKTIQVRRTGSVKIL